MGPFGGQVDGRLVADDDSLELARDGVDRVRVPADRLNLNRPDRTGIFRQRPGPACRLPVRDENQRAGRADRTPGPDRVRRRGGVCAGRDSEWDRCRAFSHSPPVRCRFTGQPLAEALVRSALPERRKQSSRACRLWPVHAWSGHAGGVAPLMETRSAVSTAASLLYQGEWTPAAVESALSQLVQAGASSSTATAIPAAGKAGAKFLVKTSSGTAPVQASCAHIQSTIVGTVGP